MVGQVGVERDRVALARGRARRRRRRGARRPSARPRSRGCRPRASADRPGRPWRRRRRACAARPRRAGPAAAGSAPRSGGRRRGRPARRSSARTTVTPSPSSRRSSCESESSRPAAILAATASVGLVSPRSTWESIGADTPLRSARSRSDRSIASRRALIRDPTVDPVCDGRCHAAYAITYVCMS